MRECTLWSQAGAHRLRLVVGAVEAELLIDRRLGQGVEPAGFRRGLGEFAHLAFDGEG